MDRTRNGVGSIVSFLMKLLVSFIFIFPFLWMLSLSLQSDAEIARFTLIPQSPTLENFANCLLYTSRCV